MQQSKLGSFIESLMNIAIGLSIAMTSQIILFPMFGIDIPLSSHWWLGAWFTVISIIRSYVIRRWFNARLHKAAEALADKARHTEDKRQ